jgi:hypothetical protein
LEKKLDLKKSVFELTEEFPELIEILKALGFLGITNFVMRTTVGRITTLPEGCKKMGKDINEVLNVLKEKGFEIVE